MSEKSGEQTEARIRQCFAQTNNSLRFDMPYASPSHDRQRTLMVWSRQTLHWCHYWDMCDTGIYIRRRWKMLQPCFCSSASVWAVISGGWPVVAPSLPYISPHLYRCLRMTGAGSLHWGRMMRSRAGGCAVAATSRPWQKKTVATQTAAPNPRPRSRHDEPATWKPHSRPSQRWPRSSKCVL